MSSDHLTLVIRKIILYIFLWYATWTVGCNIITFFKLPSFYLPSNLIFSILSSSFFYKSLALNKLKDIAYQVQVIHIHQLPMSRYIFIVFIFFAIFIAAIILYIYKNMWLFLYMILVVLLAAFLCFKNLFVHFSLQNGDFFQRKFYQILFFSCTLLLIYFLGHQSDADDANYINLAIGAFRSTAGVFELDSMLGDGPNLIHLPTYKVQSYELLFGTLAYLFPGSTLFYAHIVLPTIFIILLGLSLYNIYYTLFRGYWLIAALLHMSASFLMMDLLPSYGAHGLFRFFQGKSIFLNLIIPLCTYHAVLWLMCCRWVDWFMVFILQICSVGMTANSIYIAPLCLGLIVLPFFLANIFNLKRYLLCFLSILSSIYPIVIGSILILSGNVYPSEILTIPDQGNSIYTFLGWNLYGIIMLSIFLMCPFIIYNRIHRCYIFLYIVGVFLVIFNPLLWNLMSYVSGNLTIRIYWAVPFPLSFSFFFVNIFLHFSQYKKNKKIFFNMCCLLAMSIFVFSIVTVSNNKHIQISWKFPRYRVQEPFFTIANELMSSFSEECKMLVSEKVATNLVMLDKHPYPVAVASIYQEHYRHTMNKSERLLRSKLLNSLSDNNTTMISFLDIASGIDLFDINVILIRKYNINYEKYYTFSINNYFSMKDISNDMVLFFKPCR